MVSRRRRDEYRAEREDFIKTPSLTTLLRPTVITTTLRQPIYSPDPIHVRSIEDRRLYRPDRTVRPPAATIIGASRVTATRNKSNLTGLRFLRPNHVALCARRKIRRQVIHALRIAGKKGTGKGRHRRTNFWSDISC